MRTHATLATLLLGLTVVFLAPTAKADCPHNNKTNHPHCNVSNVNDPQVLIVTVDLDSGSFGQIFIEGEGFLPAGIDPEVTLAAGAPIIIVSATDSTIEADLPDLADGDYLLVVTTFDENGVAAGSDSYDLTVGAVGLIGPAGVPGLSEYEVVTAAAVVLVCFGVRTSSATCPVGKKAIGGGWSSAEMRIRIVQSTAIAGGTGWTVSAWKDENCVGGGTFRATAICALVQ